MYKMNNNGPSIDPRGTPYFKENTIWFFGNSKSKGNSPVLIAETQKFNQIQSHQESQ